MRESGNAEGLLPTSNGRTDGMGGSAGAESDEVKDRKNFEQMMLAQINQRMQDINAEIARLNARIHEAEEEVKESEKLIREIEQNIDESDEAMAAWQNGAPLTEAQRGIVAGVRKAYKSKTGHDLDKNNSDECEKALDEYKGQENERVERERDVVREQRKKIQENRDKIQEKKEDYKKEEILRERVKSGNYSQDDIEAVSSKDNKRASFEVSNEQKTEITGGHKENAEFAERNAEVNKSSSRESMKISLDDLDALETPSSSQAQLTQTAMSFYKEMDDEKKVDALTTEFNKQKQNPETSQAALSNTPIQKNNIS
ncbi:MAG: hypothetical protein WBK77_10315 [Alphaproteobacteria bacterium]